MLEEPIVPDWVLDAYGIDGGAIEVLAGGRTNRTMRVRAGRDLVLQHLNGTTHHDVLGVMENLVRVTSHLRWRDMTQDDAILSDRADESSWFPELVPTIAGKPFMMDDAGDVWRAFSYRPGVILRGEQPVSVLAGAASLYGRFTAATADLGGPELITTAPGFHDLGLVYDAFVADLQHAPAAKRSDIEPHLDSIERTRAEIDTASAADGLFDVASRVVHNDTKLSNVLFGIDAQAPIEVLDLDLAQSGPVWHDVGDLVRSSAWHCATADCPRLDAAVFEAVITAFRQGAAATLTDAEVATFAMAGPRISLELGIRYLHDHLRDEPHLRVAGHNGHLLRGSANMKLAQEMFGAYDALRPLVEHKGTK